MQQEIREPLTIFYAYAYEDEPLRKELDKHLSILIRQGLISSWSDRQIVAGTNWEQEIDRHLEMASIILLLVSADFLSSDYSYSTEMYRIVERHCERQTTVIPIILRPCDWHGAPFSKLQCLPLGGKPVTSWRKREEAFVSIMQVIRRLCDQLLQEQLLQSRIGETSQESQNPADDIEPLQVYPLYDVFVKSGTPTLTFIEPTDFEALQHALAQPGRGVVIEGPSGIGKTTAVEKAIELLATKRRLFQRKHPIELLSARDPDHRLRLQTLRQWHTGTVIIDDFHRLDPSLRQDLVDYLKYLADTSSKSRKLVVVGIPRTGQTLVDASFDVSTRIDVFQLGHVTDELILQMIGKGEAALNVLFDRKVEIALASMEA